MTNPRDTGRYDAIAQEYIDQQVRVDFAWGNIPMQPDDDRGEATLNPLLDSHIIAVAGYQNFPSFTAGTPFDDTLLNVSVPNIVGLSAGDAEDALADVGLEFTQGAPNEEDATLENDGTVASQTPTAGTVVNIGDTVTYVAYHNPLVTVPNVVDFDSVSAAESFLVSSGLVLGNVTTSTVGATTSNWGWVKSQNPASGTSVAPGTAVDLVSYDYVSSATTGSIAGFNRTSGGALGWSVNGDQTNMFVTGRQNWPAIGSTVVVTGTSNSTYNTTYTVADVKADNSYNTGGTAIKLTRAAGGSFTGNTSSGGTWAFPVALYGPTTNWSIGIMGTSNQMWLGGSSGTFSALSVVEADPAGYKIVITGGTIAGQYTIAAAYYDSMMGGYYLGGTSITPTRLQGAGASGSLTVDAGSVSIFAV